MVFPQSERVIYKKNPLVNVICQLRFPPILRIDTEVPSGFQDAIRQEYPIYNEQVTYQQQLTMNLAPTFPQNIMNQITETNVNKNHVFSSEDNTWSINLTRTFISITSSRYQRWEEFEEKFRKPFDALIKEYTPPFFSRTGLRYVDVFCRSKYDLANTSWKELIEDSVLGLLATDFLNEKINNLNNICEIALDDSESIVKIATSLVKNINNKEGENCLMVDSDFYTSKRLKKEEVFQKLDFLNSESTNLISWVVQEKLHNAMGPSKL
jgi:uncharacterized protein (TIGR04255 family)